MHVCVGEYAYCVCVCVYGGGWVLCGGGGRARVGEQKDIYLLVMVRLVCALLYTAHIKILDAE